MQACRRSIVQRHETGLAELGLADQQTVDRHVRERELECFGDAQPRGREQGDQSRIRLRAQASLRSKPAGGLDQATDLRAGVNVRRSTSFTGAEVISRGQIVPGIFNADMACEAADGLQPSITLRNGRCERGPIDGCLCVDMRVPALNRKGGKALEQVLGIRHGKARGTT